MKGGGTFVPSGLAGTWIYGTGSGGDMTLVANTTLANDDCVLELRNLYLGGFALTHSSSDYYLFIQVKDTLDGGGGRIHVEGLGGASGAGGTGGSSAGDGAAGGAGGGSVYVFARIAKDVTISADGAAGGVGTSATQAIADQTGTVGANPTTASINTIRGVTIGATVTSSGGGGGSNPYAGTGCTMSAALKLRSRLTYADLYRVLFVPGETAVDSAADPRCSKACGGAGGGAGGSDTNISSPAGTGGGGGGGGRGLMGDGCNGGAGVAGALGADNAAGGGAGGGGGGGGEATLVCDISVGVVLVRSNGGAGGTGGSSYRDGVTSTAGGAGGGGGGGGGVALGVGPTVTVSTSAGSPGSGGAGIGAAGGAVGVTGVAINEGLARALVRI